jgi:hypothetical protein
VELVLTRWIPRASILLVLCACDRYWVCDLPERIDGLPRRLSETGLYTDIATGQLADDVVAYTPAFELWSDGADKQRWIRMPDGERIDSTDMDAWSFPVGTKVWKEFSVAGVRVETRLLEKRGADDDDWVALSYVWEPDDRDASAAPLGVLGARGTEHDVPGAGECAACHRGRRSFVLGFSAVQLSADAVVGEIDLSDLVAQGRLTAPPARIPVVPGTAIERAALGYLHANCSHCHNRTRPDRDGARCFDPGTDFDFTLAVDDLGEVATTATYRTAVGDAIKPGEPGASKVIDRMGKRGLRGMPPLATAKVDTEARAVIRQWIEALR